MSPPCAGHDKRRQDRALAASESVVTGLYA